MTKTKPKTEKQTAVRKSQKHTIEYKKKLTVKTQMGVFLVIYSVFVLSQ